MNSNPPTPRAIKLSAYIDVSTAAQEYGIRAGVLINPQVFTDYDAYPSAAGMLTRECIVSVLSYALHRARDARTVSVILTRSADNRPVEVAFQIRRQQYEDRTWLVLELTRTGKI